MKQLIPMARSHHRSYVPMQIGQPVSDGNYTQQQTKANQRQMGQPLSKKQQQ